MQSGSLFDGSSARAHAVQVAAEKDGIRIELDNGRVELAPTRLLRRLSEDQRQVRLIRSDVEGWSLRLDKPLADDLLARLPRDERYGRWIDKVGLAPALIVLAVLTTGVVATGYLAPHWIAPHVPMRWERKFGETVFGDFRGVRCANPRGQQALETLVERVAPGATKGPDGVKVAAVDVPIFNAVALPGGYIVVFKPAITETDSDALAGVIAHEIAHVRRRHVTEALIRELGIGALIRMFAGNLGANAEQMLALSYTRTNETQADGDAIDMLRRAGISPRPTAALFTRFSKIDRSAAGTEWLQRHPLSGKRARAFDTSFDPHARYEPALSDKEQAALANICNGRESKSE